MGCAFFIYNILSNIFYCRASLIMSAHYLENWLTHTPVS